MGLIIPRNLRTNATSTAVWLASKRRNALRNGSGGFPNPVNAIYNYLFKDRQDLIDNVSKVVSAQHTGGLTGLPVFTSEGLLNEGEATNYIDYSNDLENAAWTKTNCAASSGGVSPIAGLNYYDVTIDAGTSNNFIGLSFSTVSGNDYIYWLGVEKQAGKFLQITGSTGFAAKYVNFDLSDGAIGNASGGVTAYTEDMGSWLKLGMSEPATATGSSRFLVSLLLSDVAARLPSQTYTGAESYSIFHNQAEDGDTPTSIITTTGSPVTREADFTTIPTSDAFYDSPETSTVPCVVGDTTNANITNGIGNEGGANDRFINMAGSGVASKYAGLLTVGAVLTSTTNGVVIECEFISSNNWRFMLPARVNDTGLSDYDAVIQGFENDGTSSNKIIVDWSRSGNDLVTQKALRSDAGDQGADVDGRVYDFPNTDQYVSVPSTTLSGTVKKIRFKHKIPASSTAISCALSGAVNDDFVRIDAANGELELRINAAFRTDSVATIDGEEHSFELVLTEGAGSDNYTAYQDGVLVVNVSGGSNFGEDFEFSALGKRIGGAVNYFDGPLYDVEVEVDGVIIDSWGIHDGKGSTSIASSSGTRDGTPINFVDANWGGGWTDITATDKVTIPSVILDAATANQVLLQSGDTGVFYDGANLVADVNGTTDSLPIAYDAIESAGYVYDGANIKVILNGVDGAGTASAAPALGNYFSIGSNTANINPASGVYGGVLVETP